MSGSEIARLRRQLEAEYLAGRWALYGLACGWAKHEYIQRRLRNMEEYQSKLARLVGQERAAAIVCEVIDEVRDQERATRPVVPVVGGEEGGEAQARVEVEVEVEAEVEAPAAGTLVGGVNGKGALPVSAWRSQGEGKAEAQAEEDEDEEEPERPIEKILWLLAYRHGEEEADLLYLFYAISDEEAKIIADLKMEQAGRRCRLLSLRKLPSGFGVPYGRYRGRIHVRSDGSIVEGDYLTMRTIARE
ncbi:hypothetical protein [Thermogemmatispora carboxidivorans]|uniref:hypothetical protein n=1 Tax=Thermogemmatispora carboxidivorans TaxID=1382306 RepID=UPI0006995A2A|nr:hypothetical protein [Thermogemmatispora carboxidivorans]